MGSLFCAVNFSLVAVGFYIDPPTNFMKQGVRFAGLVLLLIIQMVLVRWAAAHPHWIETYYTHGFYETISAGMRWSLGWIPFSIGDLIYVLASLFVLFWLWKHLRALLFLKSENRFSSAIQAYIGILLTANIVYAYFHLSWGMNYYRPSIAEQLSLETEYEDDQLYHVTTQMLEKTIALHHRLQPDDSLKVNFEKNQYSLFAKAETAYDQDLAGLDFIDFDHRCTKKSLLTMPLSYMGYGGYLNPFTGEAQVNGWIRNYKTPVLILHEMAHQLGYARENEANFIAIQAGIHHPDPRFQLSALMFGLRYCLKDVHRRDPERFENYRARMNHGLLLDYQELTDFWKQYEGVIEDAMRVTYDGYLRANNQPGGIKTYSYVTSLLVNYYQQHEL